MTKAVEAAASGPAVRDRIIVALDVSSAAEADTILSELSGSVGGFKIGLQLFTATGPGFVQRLARSGERVFLDLKFHDIPSTVAKASVEAARLGVWMFNVHATGGADMMRATMAAVADTSSREGLQRPLVIGVTVLTSSDMRALQDVGVASDVEAQVVRLARLAADAGLDGVVASAIEAEAIGNAIREREFLKVTPGIRPTFATLDDQRRVTTIGQALANGSDYVVIGRPITMAADRQKALEDIIQEVEA